MEKQKNMEQVKKCRASEEITKNAEQFKKELFQPNSMLSPSACLQQQITLTSV
jgi:hypothetical protein